MPAAPATDKPKTGVCDASEEIQMGPRLVSATQAKKNTCSPYMCLRR